MRHTFFSCDKWIGKTVARVITSPVIDGTCNGLAIVFTDGTEVDFSGDMAHGVFWITQRPTQRKRVPIARRVQVRGSRTHLPQGMPAN